MERKSTTDLSTVRSQPDRFTWGQVFKVHDVGTRYSFVEYEPRLEFALKTGRSFHIYVDGTSLGRSTSTLEGALIYAIAFANLKEVNLASHMAAAAAKLLDVNG
jgi:hypothetical protein